MVRQRSAKPLFIGSIPIAASTYPQNYKGRLAYPNTTLTQTSNGSFARFCWISAVGLSMIALLTAGMSRMRRTGTGLYHALLDNHQRTQRKPDGSEVRINA